MTEEIQLWKGSPSQWLNIGPISLAIALSVGICLLGLLIPFPPAFAALILPLAWAVWRYLVVRCQTFELTTERLRLTSGVINQNIDEIELYRVKDSLMTRPWWMRITGLATIELQTSDRSLPTVIIPAIHSGVEVREQLRKQVELVREKKRVREMDFDETGGDTEVL